MTRFVHLDHGTRRPSAGRKSAISGRGAAGRDRSRSRPARVVLPATGTKLTAWTGHRFLVLARMLVIAALSGRLVTGSAGAASLFRAGVRLGHADRRRRAHAPRPARAGRPRLGHKRHYRPGGQRARGGSFGLSVASHSRTSPAPAAVAEVVSPTSGRPQPRPRDRQPADVLSPALTVEWQARLYGLPKR
jgi:hypothetical protein